jgi:hypothetical protein
MMEHAKQPGAAAESKTPDSIEIKYELDEMPLPESDPNEKKRRMLDFKGVARGRAFEYTVIYPSNHSAEDWFQVANGDSGIPFGNGKLCIIGTLPEFRADDVGGNRNPRCCSERAT